MGHPSKSWVAGLLALAGLGGGVSGLPAAQAAPQAASTNGVAAAAAGDALWRLAPARRAAQARAQAAARHGNAAARLTLSSLDTTPPQLVAIQAGTSVLAADARSQLVVQIRASDDLSGLSWMALSAVGPTGQRVDATVPQVGGVTRYSGVTALNFSPFAEAGAWRVDQVFGRDLAGNAFVIEGAGLAALGNTLFTVNNPVVDAVAPTLVAGKMLSKNVSHSKPADGTVSTLPLVRLQVNVMDSGTAGLSGVGLAFAYLCQADGWTCFGLRSDAMTVYGLEQGNLLIEAVLTPDVVPGLYMIREIELLDQAGNSRLYQSHQFGGGTDFSTLISPNTVTVRP